MNPSPHSSDETDATLPDAPLTAAPSEELDCTEGVSSPPEPPAPPAPPESFDASHARPPLLHVAPLSAPPSPRDEIDVPLDHPASQPAPPRPLPPPAAPN